MRPADNPFRASAIESLLYQPTDGRDWHELLRALEATDRRGAVVGPHGSGKTTLLDRLEAEWRDAGRDVLRIEQKGDGPPLHTCELRRLLAEAPRHACVLFDGFDQLRWRARRWLVRASARFDGFVLTSHKGTPLPVWVETRTDADLARALARRLVGDAPPPSPVLISRLLDAHQGNMRELWHALFDQYGSR